MRENDVILGIPKTSYTASENLAADKRHSVLQYFMTIIEYTQLLLDMEDLFGTSANCTVGI